MKRKINNIGFTLAEVTMTMVIVAILATIALPKLNSVVEGMRTKEGEQYLYSIYSAQQRYAKDHDDLDASTSDYAGNILVLDVDFSATSNFDQPEVRTTDPFGKVTRNNGSYTLYISQSGTITCNGANCQKLGYSSESSPW